MNQASLDRVLKKRITQLAQPLQPEPTQLSPRFKSLSGIKAVLFDVYGTMLIAGTGDIGTDREEAWGNQIIESTLNDLEITTSPEISEYDAFGLFHQLIKQRRQKKFQEGNPAPEINILNIWRHVFEQLEAEGIVKDPCAEDSDFLQRFAVEFELRFNPCWPMPGLAEVLQELHQNEYLLGIISNSQFYTPLSIEALLDTTIEELGFESTLLQWSYEHGIAKPAVGFYEPIVERLYDHFDIKPEESLFIGNDMLNDVYPANELKMNTALFAGDKHSLKLRENDERTANLEPTIRLTSLRQLRDKVLKK